VGSFWGLILTFKVAYNLLYSARHVSITGIPVPAPPLVIQTTYAELLERCAATAFTDAFPEDGTFTSKLINERRYWYFQVRTPEGRAQRYVGPESPELLQRIEHHRLARDDERERRALVSTLVRSFGLPSPIPKIGDIVAALQRAGIFRLRSVVVGTVAYQCYPAMLGQKLPSALLQTSDVDIAQFTSVSLAMEDRTRPMIEILKGVDKTFREVPQASSRRQETSYVARGGWRVDFVTPNEGPDTDDPRVLPALQTAAQPLRFLDFLIYQPVPAVVLHGTGIYVQVPAPERFAVHKLILSRRRPLAVAKRDKDLQQAEALIEVLVERRPDELKLAWEETHGRGPTWRRLLLGGMTSLSPHARDLTLRILARPREILPGIQLTFSNPPIRYDSARDVITFDGQTLGGSVRCSVSREALEDHFDANNRGKVGRIEAFQKSRSKIETLLRLKYLTWPVEEPGSVLLRTMDVENLSNSIAIRDAKRKS
jgi:hypothetical protein